MTRCAATLTIDAAAAIRWDAVIVGAGPAGGSAALRLARHGLRVLLIDRGELPRGKLCGCCLSPAAVDELARLAIEDDGGPLRRAVPLRQIRVAAGGATASIDVAGGATLSRESLDAGLVAAAIAAGCAWLPGVAASAVDEREGAAESVVVVSLRAVDESREIPLECRRLLLATGLGDHVRLRGGAAEARPRIVAPRSRIGIGAVLPPAAAALPPGALLMAVAPVGYCGIVRLEDGRIDVAAAVDRRELNAGGPAALLRRIVTDACGAGADAAGLAGLESAAMRATPPLTRSAPLVAGRSGAVLRIGDAAGYVEPFTGEGMGWALAAGRLAADAVVDSATGRLVPAATAGQRYEQAHGRHFGPRHARCRRVASGLRVPRLVRLAVRAAHLAPWAARLAVPAVTGAGDRGGLRLVAGAAP